MNAGKPSYGLAKEDGKSRSVFSAKRRRESRGVGQREPSDGGGRRERAQPEARAVGDQFRRAQIVRDLDLTRLTY